MKTFLRILLVLFLIYNFSSCRKEDDFKTDAITLDFSEDTIMFDTVFTTIGSTTGYLTVYNNESKAVKISSIRLAKGNASSYRLNVDGVATRNATDVEIGPKDSLFIFIEITIDPNSSTSPFLVTDSILFESDGNLQDVDLVAFGQNAHFFTPTGNFGGIQYSVIPCNAVWDSLLPYVIYGYAVVDTGCTLTINKGTKVHFYQNSGLWVFQGGTLKVKGSYEQPVIFEGTRLELAYDDVPGQWDRIWINEGAGNDSNEIDWAIIKNGFIGLQPENLFTVFGGNPRILRVTNTIIKNMSGFGILSRDYTVHGVNNLIANCGQYLAAFTIGGSYDFLHCTFANYWNQGQRTTPSIYINNYYTDVGGDVAVPLSQADFKNCIIYGNIDGELELDFNSGATSNYFFGNCLLRNDTSIHINDALHFENIFSNTDPGFSSTSDNDYTLDSLSAAVDHGNPLYFSFDSGSDLNNKPRPVGNAPDLGAYEKQ